MYLPTSTVVNKLFLVDASMPVILFTRVRTAPQGGGHLFDITRDNIEYFLISFSLCSYILYMGRL